MEKKYELIKTDTICAYGRTLFRVRYLCDIENIVAAGDIGGYIEGEYNLSQQGNSVVLGDAEVYGNAKVCGDAKVYGNAKVCGDAMVFGNAKVCGDAKVQSTRDYIVFKNFWSSGRHFTWTRSDNKWTVGCFYGTGEELIAKAYKDSQMKGREYERVVRYVESILEDEKADRKELTKHT